MKHTLIDAVWSRLPHIARLEFQASPGTASDTQWQGHGMADVRVESTASAIRFIESGQFWPHASSPAVSIRNAYLWQRDGQALLLSHERLGRESEVFLLRFTPIAPDTMEGGEPHLCGQDQYRATLCLTSEGIRLVWAVTGPHKDEHLVQTYSA
ncbi:MAG TPA: DUF6314 family protein [Castellaniella sp.]|uniref:DUF6314 family protein n=1 Tax=Castellaniella sp. TaxID=1955812 RepID=UPI002EFF72FD